MSRNDQASGLLVVAGPTSSGKTGLGIELARQLGGAVISADSRMVFAGLDIGTGKPTWEHRVLERPPWIGPDRTESWGPVYQIEGIEHHLLDVVLPETRFTLTDWLKRARAAIASIGKQGQQPIVVGGTGLYLKALVEGFEPPPTDLAVRAAIEELPSAEILAELKRTDPETATREFQNRRRLVRALEVVRLTGKSLSAARTVHPRGVQSTLVLAIDWLRPELYRRIDQRIDARLNAGMVQEVEHLLQQGVQSNWLQSLGLEYRILISWLERQGTVHPRGVQSKEVKELRRQLQGAIHAYARRQLIWLRHQLPVRWIPAPEAHAPIKLPL